MSLLALKMAFFSQQTMAQLGRARAMVYPQTRTYFRSLLMARIFLRVLNTEVSTFRRITAHPGPVLLLTCPIMISTLSRSVAQIFMQALAVLVFGAARSPK